MKIRRFVAGVLLAFLLAPLLSFQALADEAGPTDELLEAIADETEPLDTNSGGTVNVYRLYNWRTSEHLYTTSEREYNKLPWDGWVREGIAWVAPKKSSTPVYRLYNLKSGDHHYTTSKKERDSLTRKGWRYEGVAFYSDDSKRVPLYRVYNGRLRRGQHHYTTSKTERNSLVNNSGWRSEGIGFYAVRKGKLMTAAYPNSVPAGTYRGTSGSDSVTYVLNLDGTLDYMTAPGVYRYDEEQAHYGYHDWFPYEVNEDLAWYGVDVDRYRGQKVIELGGSFDETGLLCVYRASGRPRLEDIIDRDNWVLYRV